MKVQPAAFLRTTLPLALDQLDTFDSGRYHSLWLPDHMVSFWPDSIWTTEFTDLAATSHSPHRHLDGMALAAAAAVLTKNVPIATSVVDTVRRHPAMIAQTAITLNHLSCGRFILGIGSGELENTVPYGFDFSKPVSRFEEALKVIRLLWDSEGPVNFTGQFFTLDHARMDAEHFGERAPAVWIGASGPRMLNIAGRYADGWWPAGAWSPDDYALKLAALRSSAERAGRDPMRIVPALIQTCLIGDDAELAEMAESPLIKAYALQIPAGIMRAHGYEHPLGEDWRGFQDINPSVLTREHIVEFLAKVDPQSIIDIMPSGSPRRIARILKDFVDAGLRVPKILDYGGMAGIKFATHSADKVRATEDELLALTGAVE